jgi:uncharacterized membrane protein YbaN (DUF454 family)
MTAVQRKLDHPHRLRAESAATIAPQEDRPLLPPLSPVRRAIYLFIAAVAFALGMLGVFLPGLPTTPFLLVTSALLLRAWPAMHERMLRSRFVGGMLSDWRTHRGVRPHVKVRAITLVVAVVTATIILGGLSALAAAAAGGCAGIGILVIVLLPSVRN